MKTIFKGSLFTVTEKLSDHLQRRFALTAGSWVFDIMQKNHPHHCSKAQKML